MQEYKYVDVVGGKEYVKELRCRILESCCDCGLTHAVFYNIEVQRGKRVITKMMYRDDYETNRKGKKK